MKKILFVIGAVGLLAAGCGGTANTSVNTVPTDQQQAQATPTPTPSSQPTPTNQPTAQMQAQANATVQVNGADDAVNVLLKNSSDEQTKAAAGEDSDLTSSDSASLTGVTEVSNGF